MKLALGIGMLALLAAGGAIAGDPGVERAWWKAARTRIEEVLATQGRSPEDLESPPWYEVPYNTVGRMPLIETGLREPLLLPEIALSADDAVKGADGRLADLNLLAWRMAEETSGDPPPCDPLGPEPAWLAGVAGKMDTAGVPAEARDAARGLLAAIARATALRDEAFAALTPAERKQVAEGLPGWFVRKIGGSESVRGYTAEIDDCIDLIDVLRKVDFAKLACAGRTMAVAGDAARNLVPGAEWSGHLEVETPLGKVAIGGSGDDTWTGEYVLLLDLGGNDLYRNHPAATSLDGFGAAALVDVAGDDIYRADRFAQGSAIAGTALFMDLAGDDSYVSGHYSQGAALAGTALFYEGSGDDTYVGDLGVQSFAIFGTSVFVERSGRDTYRCASMGQAAASTLGIAILAEGGGDDAWRSGGKHGFYSNYDASTAQGSASGMRPWPPSGKITVWGGIGFLSEAGGSDTYNSYIIGQGGSYIFALGMLVDSAGNDTYTRERYCNGVGVHLSAGVAVDREGNDTHNGFYGNDGYSLDRSSGVFVDLAGDDTYRTTGGIGFGHKPKGTGIFFDAQGNDTYAGTEGNYGKADWPFGDEAISTGFFLDFGGKDFYRGDPYRNDATWSEGTHGYGEDAAMEKPPETSATWWSLRAPESGSAVRPKDPETARIADLLLARSPLVRLTASGPVASDPAKLMDAIAFVASFGDRAQRRNLIDILQYWTTKKKMTEPLAARLAPTLDAGDRDVRLMTLNVARALKMPDSPLLRQAATLALEDPSWEVRSMACLALGASKWKGAEGTLVQALHDDHWRVRRRAAVALGDLKAKGAGTPLLAALKEDDAMQVRGWAARGLGEIHAAGAVPALEAALGDPVEFVRCQAARTLLVRFGRRDAMERLFDLLAWPNGPMRDDWVVNFLRDYTGQGLGADDKAWRAWWEKSSATFDLAAHEKTWDELVEARKIKGEAEEEKALDLFRRMHRRLPEHEGVRTDLADLLNSLAWKHVVEGTELGKALRMAKESVEVRSNAQALDTLAVLYHLTGEKEKAIRTLEEALPGATDADRGQYEMRLGELRKGELRIQ